MNNTTTYKRSMFGLSEINADIINCNDLTLSGSLKTNLITSTAAGQSLSVDALGTGSLNLKSGGVTKLSMSNTETSITSNDLSVKDGKFLRVNNTANSVIGSIGMNVNSQLTISISTNNHIVFLLGGFDKFRLRTDFHVSALPITAPTEAVGSNNTRLATTAFVTTATLGLTGITYSNVGSIDMTTIDNNVTISTGKVLTLGTIANVETELLKLTGITYSDVGSIDMTTIDNNVTISTGKVLTIGTIANAETELLKLTGMDYSDPDYTTFVYSILTCDNTFTLPSYPDVKLTLDNLSIAAQTTTGITYNSGTDTTTISNNLTIGTGKILSIPNFSNVESTLTNLIPNLLSGINAWTGTNTFNTNLPTSTLAPTIGDQLTNKTYVDSVSGTGLLSLNNTWTGTNTFNTNLPTSTITPTTATQLTTKTYVDNQISVVNERVNDLYIKKYEDDFLDGFNTCPIPWTSTGTGVVAVTTDEPGHVGNVRMIASNDRILYPTSTNIRFYWEYFVKMEFCIKTQIVIGNPNHDFIVGLSDNNGMSNDTILWSYTSAAGMWEMKVNGVVYQTAPGVSLSNDDYFYGFIESKPALGNKMVRFYLKNLNTNEVRDWTSVSNITTIDLAATYRPFFRVRNTDGVGTKSMFIDYVSIQHLKY